MKKNYSVLVVSVAATLLFIAAFVLVAMASEMDSRIESSAQKSYVYKTYLKDDTITIQSKDGAVTLVGSVAEEFHKSLAQETVENLPGVKSVDNQLVLKGESPVENSDGWLGMKVKTALLFHRNVNAFKTEVDVKDGVVTLKGEALSQAQKDLAGEYAKDVDGVKDVKNEMSLAKASNNNAETLGEKIDDASITAQIKMALLSHYSTSAVNTKVVTTNGVVTISGMAKNDAEKVLVTKLADDINGVTNVINNMTIADSVLSKK
ncbi:MAG: BON domain-containing protein [Candidatus Omnitrophica bacterium]|nr:BON domain-containing protein [Candidatus Omnitrophota bacterium]